MIFISKLIAKFIKAVLAIMNSSNEHIETSENIVEAVGSFTASDKVIQPIKVVESYLFPKDLFGRHDWTRDGRFVFYAIGGSFVVTDTLWGPHGWWVSWRTTNFTSWSRINDATPLGFSGRILPEGTTSHYGYNQINRISDEFGFKQGVNVPRRATIWTGFENEPSSIKYLQRPRVGIVSFLYSNRRVTLGNNWSLVSNAWNQGDSMMSPGWFFDGDMAPNQAYSAVERELLHRRVQLPHPSAGITVGNITYPLTTIQYYLSDYNAIAEDVNGNIYSIHRNSGLFLTKNFEYQEHWLIDSLDPSSRFRKSLRNYFAGERGYAEPKITCIEEDIFISQYNKIFKLNNNLELQTIYEAPCMIEQLTSDGLYLYLVSKGGVVKCLP